MKETTHDVLIVGLGAMGSAAAFHLARRGLSVLGLDRFSPPHTQGSSHGQTRIIREAYFEHPSYVPLLRRAYTLWGELEEQSRESLLLITGGLMLGPADGEVFPGSLRSAREHGLPHEVLGAAEVRRRFPALQPGDELQAVWEPRAGILLPERCIDTHLRLARLNGAKFGLDETVLEWQPDGAGLQVRTTRGIHRAGALLLTAGAWLRPLLRDFAAPLTVERQVLFWMKPDGPAEPFARGACPIHLWETADRKLFYGFPDLGDGVKIARHHDGEPATPDTVDRTVRATDEEPLRHLLARHIPGANGPVLNSAVCLYTNTPDGHFWIDRHPHHARVVLGSPCSGHGFKFASVMGEVLAGEILGEKPAFDLSLFRTRWTARQG